MVITAAGKGTRMNLNKNKVYIPIEGVPIIARTVKVFNDCNLISNIILVVNRDDIPYCKQNIVDFYGFEKVKKIIPGGKTRQASVFNGLSEIENGCQIVVIHDGVRPFVREETIKESIYTAMDIGASCSSVPIKDTIKRSDSTKFVKETLNRENLWSIQTPQTFKVDLIMNAHKKAIEDNFIGTDDAILVERMGIPIKLIEGSYDNIKITTVEDLIIAKTMINNLSISNK